MAWSPGMMSVRKRGLSTAVRGVSEILYHVAVIAMSAGLALSLPFAVRMIAKNLLLYWSFIENEKNFLVFVEVLFASGLILVVNYGRKSWRDSRDARLARGAGLEYFFPRRGRLMRRRIRRLKERQGFARDVMVMGSTGFRTFVDPRGDLHRLILSCRQARILLLNPYSEGALARVRSLLVPEVTPERFEEHVRTSIEFLRGVKAGHRDVRLKLYPDPPFLKVTVLGEYIWMKHYHVGLDVDELPEYVFVHRQNPGGFYATLYQYFMRRWDDPAIPEYDLETDELVYRDTAGHEVSREKFGGAGSGRGLPP